jgi:hypothetical protein
LEQTHTAIERRSLATASLFSMTEKIGRAFSGGEDGYSRLVSAAFRGSDYMDDKAAR